MSDTYRPRAYFVAFADPASGRVIGVYSSKVEAEAAAFRFSKSGDVYADTTELRVLEFDLDVDGEVAASEDVPA